MATRGEGTDSERMRSAYVRRAQSSGHGRATSIVCTSRAFIPSILRYVLLSYCTVSSSSGVINIYRVFRKPYRPTTASVFY